MLDINYIFTQLYVQKMLYQLPNGKVINLTVEQYLELTNEDIQYMMSIDFGNHIINPFSESAVVQNTKEKFYDFDYLPDDDSFEHRISDDEPFDDIIDLSDSID
jgi:hypothetical protein